MAEKQERERRVHSDDQETGLPGVQKTPGVRADSRWTDHQTRCVFWIPTSFLPVTAPRRPSNPCKEKSYARADQKTV